VLTSRDLDIAFISVENVFILTFSIYLSNIYNISINMDFHYKNMRYEIVEERALQNTFGNALYFSLF
jgi:hypothetical protein